MWSHCASSMLTINFFFNNPASTEIYTLSLHDALPILVRLLRVEEEPSVVPGPDAACALGRDQDRKSTRLNSSHTVISYAVFCLKKKKKQNALKIMIIIFKSARNSRIPHTRRRSLLTEA